MYPSPGYPLVWVDRCVPCFPVLSTATLDGHLGRARESPHTRPRDWLDLGFMALSGPRAVFAHSILAVPLAVSKARGAPGHHGSPTRGAQISIQGGPLVDYICMRASSGPDDYNCAQWCLCRAALSEQHSGKPCRQPPPPEGFKRAPRGIQRGPRSRTPYAHKTKQEATQKAPGPHLGVSPMAPVALA